MGNGIEVVEFTGLSSPHVVRLTVVIQLRPELQESNEKDDLKLGGEWKGIPLFGWGTKHVDKSTEYEIEGQKRCQQAIWDASYKYLQIGGRVGSSRGSQRPRENEVGLDNVTNEGGHSNTSVLDLRVAKEGNGGFVAVSPDGGCGQLKGVVVLK